LESKKEWAGKKVDPLPDHEACHQALLEDEDSLEYLLVERGFSLEIIRRLKLGLTTHYFRECGEVKALVYPYLVNGNVVWAKYRTLPPSPKTFSCPSGRDAVLYNGEILGSGIKEVVLLEGEGDTVAALDHGITNVCGVPGANIKKAEWLSQLNALERIYISYDMDKVGQKAAKELAGRIGIERCYRLLLPFGKDINEWFKEGGTLEQFEQLKVDAELFDVDGVSNTSDAIQEFLDEVREKGGVEPKYRTQWDSLNALVGFDEGEVIDIIGDAKQGKSTTALNIIEHMVDTYNENGLFCCLEMTRAKLARKWISMMAGIEDNLPKTSEESKQLMDAFLKAVPKVQAKVAAREADLYFCYPKYKNVDDIYILLRDCIRRYGVKWIVLDNLQRLCDTTIGSKGRTQHLSEISKITSQIAKDHKIQMIRIIQPHRIGEGKMVTPDSADGSSQIPKDSDCTITIHRERLDQGSLEEFQAVGHIQGEGTFSNHMKVGVGFTRYSAGGYVTLDYDGARSQVREFDLREVKKMVAKIDIGYEAQLRRLGLNAVPGGSI
jgi:twinkle protein